MGIDSKIFTTKAERHKENMINKYAPLSDFEEDTAAKIVDAAYVVHKTLARTNHTCSSRDRGDG